ncbi:hypothetical protein C8R46DRAFT_638302 [Mycena filopes]|nr:hypothetical protein C8R46DRAFT_638302 [Mycena filopes]
MFSSPPAEALPPPVFDDTTSTNLGRAKTSYGGTDLNSRANEEVDLPLTPNLIKYFQATVVSPYPDSDTPPIDFSPRCPQWSPWATSQFTFDYLFMLVAPSMTPEQFKHENYDTYMDIVFKLCCTIESIGKMPDDSPPPSLVQSFYHLRRLFPNGIVARDFLGNVSTVLLRVFALGIAVANVAIYEQRNLNLEWELMCGILDLHVDGFETAALQALNWDVFDLAENRGVYLDWLGHLGYYAEFYYSRTGQTYLRSSADLIAFAHAQAFSLPRQSHRTHVHPIQLPFLETLSTMLCWGTGVTPLSPQAIQFNSAPRTSAPSVVRPTAADVLATIAEECTSRLLYPLSAKVKPFSWATDNLTVLI